MKEDKEFKDITNYQNTKGIVRPIELGEVFMKEGFTSIAQSALAYDRGSKVTEIRYKFDENTGFKYQQFKVENNYYWWDGRNGSCISNGKCMYALVLTDKPNFDYLK